MALSFAGWCGLSNRKIALKAGKMAASSTGWPWGDGDGLWARGLNLRCDAEVFISNYYPGLVYPIGVSSWVHGRLQAGGCWHPTYIVPRAAMAGAGRASRT